MPFNYRKLFHILLDKNISMGEFRKMINISAPTLSRLKHGDIVTTEVIGKICEKFNCQPNDIMEYIQEEEGN